MTHIIYTYLIINSFISGYWFNENSRWESRRYTFAVSFLSFLFGVIGFLFYFLFLFFTPILEYIYKEIRFQYRFYCTDYWDKYY